MMSIGPIIKSIDNKFIKTILPGYYWDRDFILTRLRYQTLSDFSLNSSTLKTYLHLIQAALKSSQLFLGEDSVQESKKIQFMVNDLLDQPDITSEDVRPILAALELAKTMAHEMSTSPHLHGFPEMIGNLMKWPNELEE